MCWLQVPRLYKVRLYVNRLRIIQQHPAAAPGFKRNSSYMTWRGGIDSTATFFSFVCNKNATMMKEASSAGDAVILGEHYPRSEPERRGRCLMSRTVGLILEFCVRALSVAAWFKNTKTMRLAMNPCRLRTPLLQVTVVYGLLHGQFREKNCTG